MKHVLLLDNKGLEYYDFQFLQDYYKIKVYCVVRKSYYETLSKKVKANVEKFFVLDDNNDKTATNFPYPYDFHKVKKIIDHSFLDAINQETLYISCADEINLGVAAEIRAHYHIPGHQPTVVKNFTNKFHQKRQLRDYLAKMSLNNSSSKSSLLSKVHVIDCDLVSWDWLVSHSFQNLAQKFGVPFIIKPCDMTASICVDKISTKEDFAEFMIKAKPFQSHDFIVEPFQDGQLYHVDLVTRQGKTCFAQPCEYFYNGLSFTKGKVHGSIPLEKDSEHFHELISIAELVNEQLGLENGCSHHEIFVTKEGRYFFLEAACRPPGSLVPRLYQRIFQFNIVNQNLLIDVNQQDAHFEKKHPSIHQTLKGFWAILPYQLGHISLSDFGQIRGQVMFELSRSVVKKTESASLIDRSATLIIESESRESALKDFYHIKYKWTQ